LIGDMQAHALAYPQFKRLLPLPGGIAIAYTEGKGGRGKVPRRVMGENMVSKRLS